MRRKPLTKRVVKAFQLISQQGLFNNLKVGFDRFFVGTDIVRDSRVVDDFAVGLSRDLNKPPEGL